VKSDLYPALKYVKVDHWLVIFILVNVEKLTFTRLRLRLVISDSYWKFCDVNDVEILCKFKMAAAKPEVHLSQSTNELATKFQRIYPCFLGCLLNCSIAESCFQLQIQDGGQKTEIRTIYDGTLSISCNLPVITRFRGIADSLVLMSLLLVLECIGKSNIAAAKPEIHILKYKNIHIQIQRIVVAIQCCEIDRRQITSAATSLIR